MISVALGRVYWIPGTIANFDHPRILAIPKTKVTPNSSSVFPPNSLVGAFVQGVRGGTFQKRRTYVKHYIDRPKSDYT